MFLPLIVGAITARYRLLEALCWRIAPCWNIPTRLLAPTLVTTGSILLALLKPYSSAWTWTVGQVLLGLGAGLMFIIPTVPDPPVQPVDDQTEPSWGILPSVIENYRRSMRYFDLWNEQIIGMSIALAHALVVNDLITLPKHKKEFKIESILDWGASSPSEIIPGPHKDDAIDTLNRSIVIAFTFACFVSISILLLRGLAWLWGKVVRIPWIRPKFGNKNSSDEFNGGRKYSLLEQRVQAD